MVMAGVHRAGRGGHYGPMPVDNDHDVRDDTGRRSVLVSRRTAAELTGLSLPQVNYWIRRGVVGTGGSGGRWLPRKRTTVDALALVVAVELRGRGVTVREIQAVLPHVLTDGAEWHPMVELLDVDAMHRRITAATSKVTTSTVPAVSAIPDAEPLPPPRRRIPRPVAIVAAGVLVAAVIGVAVVFALSGGRPADEPPTPQAPDAAASPAVPTSAPASATLVLPPTQRADPGRPPTIIAPSRAVVPPPTSAVPPAGAVPPAAPPTPAAPAPADLPPTGGGATAPEDGAANRGPSQQGTGDRPSGGVLGGTLNDLFGG
jgi:hypothetical protein